jgi:hypothetical protein
MTVAEFKEILVKMGYEGEFEYKESEEENDED